MRRVVYEAITGDATCNHLGITDDTVFDNYALDERPTDTSAFLVLCWEADTHYMTLSGGKSAGPRDLVVWIHRPIAISTDFADLDEIADALDDVLLPISEVTGDDGETVMSIRALGRSRDYKDEVFQTIVRTCTYEVSPKIGVS